MAIYTIVTHEDPSLREHAKLVPKITSNVLKLMDNMLDTMYSANGVGLAAPQIGVPKRVIVVDVGEGPVKLVNPEVIERSGAIVEAEGCLSCLGITGDVERAVSVTVKGLSPDGKEVIIEATDYLARALQHEIDHLNGILFTDKAKNLRKQK